MPPAEKVVLMALADMARDPDDSDRPSMAWPPVHGKDGATGLCEWTCLSERSVQRAIKCLVAAQHISRQQVRHGTIYTVHPVLTPDTVSPDTTTPDTVSPDSVSLIPVTVAPTPVTVAPTPVTVTPTPVTVAPKASRSSRKHHKAKSIPGYDRRGSDHVTKAVVGLPDGASQQQWADYDEMRIGMTRGSKPRPWTPLIARKAIESLHKLAAEGHDPGAVLDTSVLNGWVGLFPLKGNSNVRSADQRSASSVRGARPDPALDMLYAARAAEEADGASGNWAADRRARLALPASRSG